MSPALTVDPVTGLRPDLALIARWIEPGARVLDLGCGDGQLLEYLARERGVRGYGLEIDADNVAACVRRGVNVIQADLDDGLRDFEANSFDHVLLTQTLQALQRPDDVIEDILRVGRSAIVTFPNFGHWRVRQALMAGHMPVTKSLPSAWYDTTNIHLCTVADFDSLCRERGWQVRERRLLNRSHRSGASIRLAPNLFAEIAIYQLNGR